VVEGEGEAGFGGEAEAVAVEAEWEAAEVADGAGGEFAPATGAVGEVGEGLAEVAGELVACVDPLVVQVTGDVHGEPLAAGVDAAREGGVVTRCVSAPARGLGARGRRGAGDALLVVAVGAGETFEFGHLGLDSGLFDDKRVAGGEGFDLGVGEDGVSDVVEVPAGDLATYDLVDKPGLPLARLPSPNVRARDFGRDAR
jgi:hypothetical protein